MKLKLFLIVIKMYTLDILTSNVIRYTYIVSCTPIHSSSLSLPLISVVSVAWKRFDNMNFKRKRADVLAHYKGYICQHPLSQLTVS